MNQDGFTYTYRTLERLKRQNPDTDYFFIMGADSLYDFEKWREPGRILAACTVLVATRDHTSDQRLDLAIQNLKEKYHSRIQKMYSLNIDISSKLIRSWIQQGRTLAYYVPDPVISYIQENKIYRG